MLTATDKRMRRRVLGAAVIAIGVLVVLVAVLRPNPLANTHSVWVEFDSVQGLGTIDRDVRVGGANVGKIGAVERVGDNARVELILDNEDVEVRTDARADLRPHTLFEGTALVDLSPGSPSAPRLEDGETIPRAQTTVYVSLDQALRILREPNRLGLRSILREGAKTLRGGAVTGIQKTLRSSPELVEGLAPSARALQGPHGDELASAVTALSDTVDDVAAHETELIPFAKRAERTLAALEVDGGVPLDRALKVLPGALEQLERGGPDLATVVDRLGKIADETRPAIPDLITSLRGLDPLLDRAPAILERARPMIGQLDTVLRRTAEASPAIRDLTAELTPAAQTLGGSVLPFQHSPSRIGLPVYLQLFSTLTATTGAGDAFQSPTQSGLGAGHLIRLGAYFDPAGFSGSGIPSCALVEEISHEAAMQLESIGLCQP